MARKVFFVVFTIECVVLALLLCREWTLYYIAGGRAEAEYQSVYRDKVEAGAHPVTAEIDAGTTSFAIWWAGALCLLVGVAVGGPWWGYQQLWPDRRGHVGATAPAPSQATEEWHDADDPDGDSANADAFYGDDHEDARVM